MQPFGHNRNGPKIGEEAGSRSNTVSWAEAYLHAKYQLHPSSRLAAINMAENLAGALPPFWGGGAGSPSNTKSPFGRNRYWPNIAGLCPFRGGGAGSPPNTMRPGPRPICVPGLILIRRTVWPQCTNVTDRQDREDRTGQAGQRSDSIGRTVLQTVAQ